MPDQNSKTNLNPFIPVFAAQIISRRESIVVPIFRHKPRGDLPVLEPWYPHQIFGTIDHPWWKAILLGRVFFDNVVNIISRFWR